MRSFLKSQIFHSLLLLGLISLGSGPNSTWAQQTRHIDSVAGNNHTVSGGVIIIDGNDCSDPLAPCQTIGHAVEEATAGDVIDLSASTFSTGFTCFLCDPGDYGLTIDKNLTIQGQGVGLTVVDAGGADRHFTITSGAIVTIKDLTLTNGNPATDGGGAIQVQSGLLKVLDSELSNNTAYDLSGGVDDGHGGAIFLATGTELVIRRSTLEENNAGTGGAIFSEDGDVFIKKTELIDNGAARGGAIFHDNGDTGSLKIVDSTFSGNSATIDGGALLLWGSVEVKRSTFSSNEAANQGGAILIAYGDLTLFNSTVSGNTADVGGGLAVLSATPVWVYSSTFVGNTSNLGNGGAISGGGPNIDLTNTIVTDSVGGDCDGGTAAAGFVVGNSNLLDDETCALLGATNLEPVTDLELVLNDNGGPTETHALLASSSTAIDAGFGDCPRPNGLLLSHDQRGNGYARAADGDADGVAVCDIGAFELQ